MNSIKIGKRLRKLRGDRDQKDVAAAIGVTNAAISLYETGQRVPSDAIKVKLAGYFGVSVQDIFFD